MFKSLLSLAVTAALAAGLATSADVATARAAEPDASKPADAAAAKPAAEAKPAVNADARKATDMLFETKHITAVPAGTLLVYKFERKPTDEKILGKGFTDDIKVKVESEAKDGKKNVLVEMYTGERAREPNRITDMDGNPMLIVYLDTALGHYRQLAGGDRAYLKNKFSKSIAESSTLQPVKIAYKGGEIEGVKVSVTPFADDPARAKMRGFENSKFSIVLSEKVPGQFVQMISDFNNSQKDAPTLLETTTLDGVGEIK